MHKSQIRWIKSTKLVSSCIWIKNYPNDKWLTSFGSIVRDEISNLNIEKCNQINKICSGIQSTRTLTFSIIFKNENTDVNK